jgi:uncharacterized protein YbjT (DUF2867 family)
MRILLLGATGRTGAHVLEYLLADGREVHALVRDRNKLGQPRDGLKIFEGSPTDEAALAKAFRGCEYVLSVLNVSRKSDFPWSPLRSPPGLMSSALEKVLRLSEGGGVRKIVVCSAWGSKETRNDLPGWFRWTLDHSNIGIAYRDHERQEDMLRASGMNFTIVRPTFLTGFREGRGIRVSRGNAPRPRMTISRRSVARFLIRMLTEGAYSRQAVTISAE